ncbi:helix-turn-helix transcriptional regulator, partial [uncultured Thalassospira sp.]|uniref:helix-turn-helix domain-containing protein n=1 Tax=uncultured Thalassospira sp. TaxID=404382 RepID=UPI0032B157D1
KEMRKRCGLKLSDIAEAIGTTPQTVHRLENEQISLSTDWVEKIAAVLGVEPSYLVGWDTPTDTPQDERDLLDTYRALPPIMQYSTLALMAAIVADHPGASVSTQKHFKTIRDRYSGLAGHKEDKEKGGL